MTGREDAQEKAHQPTPQKLKKARERGDIARSPDLLVAVSYAGLCLAILVFARSAAEDAVSGLSGLLAAPEAARAPAGEGMALSRPHVLAAFSALAVLFALPTALVLAVLFLRRDITVTFSNLLPRPDRLSPAGNLGRRFGRAALVEFVKNAVKAAAFTAAIWLVLAAAQDDILALAALEGPQAAVAALSAGGRALLAVAALSVPVALFDMVWQHLRHLHRNRMTRRELEDELKETEGDPNAKGERRRRAREIATSRMLSEVAQADVVIVNPIHYAVALKWDRRPGTAPVCVAKGVDEIALAIRRAAERAQVPVHEDPPTARSLFATVATGEEIDPQFYRPVAAAIRFAERMRARYGAGL